MKAQTVQSFCLLPPQNPAGILQQAATGHLTLNAHKVLPGTGCSQATGTCCRLATRSSSSASDATTGNDGSPDGEQPSRYQVLKRWIRRLLLLLALASVLVAVLVAALPSILSSTRWQGRFLAVCNRFLPARLSMGQVRGPSQ